MLIINADDWEGRDLVIAQRWLPERWVIVNNGSTDRIGEIVRDYTVRSSWIELIQRPFAPSLGLRSPSRNAAAVNLSN